MSFFTFLEDMTAGMIDTVDCVSIVSSAGLNII